MTFTAAGVAGAQTGTAQRGQGAAPAPAAQGAAAPKRSPGAGPIIVFETVKGTFEMETYPNEAPKTVEHILALVKRNFYNGLRIHRYVPGFVVQWKHTTNESGLAVSKVEPVRDPGAQEGIRRLICDREMVSQVNFE